jgi:hypothetical protein
MAKLQSGTRIYGTGTVDTQLFINGGINAISTTEATLVVGGGVGISQDLRVGGLIYGVVTSATNITGGVVTRINAGTDTAVNTTTGIVTVWNTSTFQSVTDRGSETNNPITIQNTLTVANTVIAQGVDLLNFDDHVYYVSDGTGNDSNDGRRVQSAFFTIKHALSVAQSGDTVFIESGTYTEIFPLTVPQGVSVRGAGIREVTVQPTPETNNNDAFLLNGETTISDFTVSGFFKPGVAFRFAPGAKITTRSPYIERFTVLTRGSTTTTSDPYGYNAGDAGHGAHLDASVLDPTSLHPAMLWNEATFIVPNATAFYMTNGARAELLNGFTYFANKAIHTEAGTSGFGGVGKTKIKLGGISGTFTPGDTLVYKSSTGTTLATGIISSSTGAYVYIDGPSWGFQSAADASTSTQNVYSTGASPATATNILLADYHQFGAELRCIGSAACFGNQGVIANGTGTDLKLIAFNFSFIGALGDLTDDESLVVQANEVIQTNGGKVLYQSVDQFGDFRVGTNFYINERTGDIVFGSAGGTLTTNTNRLVITDGVNSSIITPTSIQTGYLSASGNTIASTVGDINISPASSSTIVNGNLTVTGFVDITQKSYINGAEIVTTATLTGNTGTQSFAGGINVVGTATIGGALIIGGNLTVGGTVTYLNSNEIDIGNKVIWLATLTNTSSYAVGAGIQIGQPSGAPWAQWTYDGGTPGNWQTQGGIVPLATGLNLGLSGTPWNIIYANSLISGLANYSTSSIAGNTVQLTAGGLGAQFLYLNQEGWIGGSKIVTVNTLSNYAVTSLTAGTDTVVTSSVGNVTVYNNSTLQSVSSRGATTNQTINITNGTNSFSTDTGALIVGGGVGIDKNMYVAGQVRLANSTNSTDVNSGALIVTGGVGISGKTTIGNQTTIYVNTGLTYPSVLSSLILDNLGSNTSGLQLTNTSGRPINLINYNGVLRLLVNSYELLYGTATALTVMPTTAASSTQTGALVVAGGVGVGGALYAGQVYDSNSRVITVDSLGSYGVSGIFAGTDTAVNTSTGVVTVWNTSTLQTVSDRGATTNNVITLTNVNNSTASNNGALVVTNGVGIGRDLWVGGIINGALKSAIATITNLQIVGLTNSTDTSTGALTVAGGVGIGGNLYIGGNGYIDGAQIVTSSTVNAFANRTTIIAGTDTAINTSTGNITIWNTSTLETVTGRGATTTNAIYVQNNIYGNAVYDNNNRVVTNVVPSGSTYIGVGNLSSSGTTATFTIYNLGVQYVTAGTDVAVTGNTGSIAISVTATLQTVTGRGATTDQAILITNGTNSTATTNGALVVSGGIGVGGNGHFGGNLYANGLQVLTSATVNQFANQTIIYAGTDTAVSANTGTIYIWNTSTLQTVTGRGATTTNAIYVQNNIYGNAVYDDTRRVVTSVVPSGSTYVGIGNLISAGTQSSFTIYNLGVNSIQGSTYIGVNANTGTVTVTNLGVQTITAGTDTVVTSSTGTVTVYGNATLQSVTGRGATTNQAISITNTLASTGTLTSNALYVAGGVGIGSSLYVTGPAVFSNNVVFNGTATYVFSTNTVYTDNILELHYPTTPGNTWGANDSKDIGLRFHYYDTQDRNGFLGRDNATGYLEWISSGVEDTTSTVSGTFGIFKAGGIILTNTTASNSTQTGALQVAGGVGIGGDLYVGGTVYGSISGSITTATNLAGGGTGQIPFQSAPGQTAFSSNLTYAGGTLTVANTTLSSSTQTGAVVVGGGVGIGGALFVNTTSYVFGAEILTSATVNTYASKTIITAGTDTAVNTSTGNVTIWNTSTLQSITSRGATTTNAIYVTNNIYGNAVYDNNNRVVTSIVPSGSSYINVGNVVSTGTQSSFTIYNVGVTNVNGNTYIGVTANTGSVTFTNLGVTNLNSGTDITLSATTGSVTINSVGTLQSVSSRGATTNQAISITNATASTSTTSGALVVTGGVGIGGALYASTTSFVFGNEIITTATVNLYSSRTSIFAGTDTAVNTSTGNVTVWNTSTLQSVTSRGATTPSAISITNASASASTNSGQALLVSGGVGAHSVYATNLFDNGNRVVTSVTPAGGTAIGIASLTSGGPSSSFTINNLGVTSAQGSTYIGVNANTGTVTFTNLGVQTLTAGQGVSVSSNTGTVTLTNTGVLSVIGTSYIGVSNTTGNITLVNLGVQTINAGTDTVVTSNTGSVTVYNNSTLQSVTNRGASTNNQVSLNNGLILGSTANSPLDFSGTYSNPYGLFIDASGTSAPTTSTVYFLHGQYTLTPSVPVLQYYGLPIIPVLNNTIAYTNMYGHYSRIDLGSSAAGSVSNWYGYVSGNPVKTGSPTTTFANHVGFRAEDPSNISSTNVSGFQSSISAGSGKYNFYAGGSANNYFAGNVGINQVNPIYPLDITGGARLTGVMTLTNFTTASSTLSGALQVSGGVGIRGDLWVGGTINGLIAGASTSATNVLIANDTTSSSVHYVTFVSSTGSYAQIKTNGPSGLTYIPNTGYHGIGTSNPISALEVVGGVKISGLTTVTNSLYANSLYDNNNRVVTSVTPSGSTYINVGGLTSTGPSTAFTIYNMGVQTLTAGTGVSVSSNTGTVTLTNTGVLSAIGTTYLGVSNATGNVTFTNLGVQTITAGTDTVVTASTGSVTVYNNSTLQTISNRGATTNNALSITNVSASASTNSGQALLVSGGIGSGPHYATQLFDAGNRVVTSVTPTGGTAIGIASLTSGGPSSSFTINNLGVTSLNGSTYIGVSASTGSVTVTNLGVQTVTAGTDTVVTASTGSITVYSNSTLQTVTNRGATTTNAVSITNATASVSTTTGALVVTGGVGIGGDLNVNGTITANQLTIQYTTVTTTFVKTDDIISTYNTTNATSTNTGALQVAGGVGIGRDVVIGGNAGVGTAPTNTNGVLQVNGTIGLAPNSQVRQWTNADGGTLKFYGTQFVAGQNNSGSYGYTGNAGIASVSASGGYITLDVGGQATGNSHRLKVVNDGTGITGYLYYGQEGGTTATLYANVATNKVGIGTMNPAYALEVNGSFAATTKSFVIDHPTRPGMRLRYGSLEGPENGVYVRGRLKGTNTIELPNYWTKLVDPDSITVDITPVGKHQKLFVKEIADNKVVIGNDNLFSKDIDCFYTVWAERSDVEKLETEIQK